VADQAQQLRELIWRARNNARILAVTSGKGGVGKTSTSVNLAIALAARGARVILMDADLGLANVEVLMGINSLYNIEHVIEGERKMRDILVNGPGGIQLVPGSSGLAKVADLTQQGRANLLNGLHELQQDADFIIIDTMAGIGRNVIAFALAADDVLLITTPEPSSIVDAYAMLKTIYANREDALIRLVINMAASPAQANAVAHKLTNVATQYLGRNLSYLGFLPRDPHASQAVMQSKPYTLLYPQAPVTKHIQDIAARLLHQQTTQEPQKKDSFLKRFAQSFGLASNQ
jgi:flagellar biosynthesis protein FlhG